MYIDFIPMFIKSWNKLYPEVDVKVILVNDSVPEKFKEYEDNIICFPVLEGISTAFISQYIRLLYPALLTEYENGIIIYLKSILILLVKYTRCIKETL